MEVNDINGSSNNDVTQYRCRWWNHNIWLWENILSNES